MESFSRFWLTIISQSISTISPFSAIRIRMNFGFWFWKRPGQKPMAVTQTLQVFVHNNGRWNTHISFQGNYLCTIQARACQGRRKLTRKALGDNSRACTREQALLLRNENWWTHIDGRTCLRPRLHSCNYYLKKIDAANLEDSKGHFHKMLKIRNPWGKR